MAEPGGVGANRVEPAPAEPSEAENAVTVCRLVADDWRAYRSIRLAMLQESPSAFCTTSAQATGLDELAWRQRLTDNAVFLATVNGNPAGSVMYSVRGAPEPGDCALFGMWVDPAFRRHGIGRGLVDAVVERARAAGKGRIVLDVVADNLGARTLYDQLGFVATGRSSPYPNDAERIELEMELVLDGIPSPSAGSSAAT